MSEQVITVEGLSKGYFLGQRRSKHDGLRHIVNDAIRAPLDWFRSEKAASKEKAGEFWALKDVSFSVNRGDIVGIVGRNGAGKSTLLKVLSRITEPSAGKISIEGRVASLLEVGTGFHPELTGRENIFLNGAILGMRRVEIKRAFDAIVAFAEVEKFLDTPVKRYSSGMYVRLAFAVAAHLEPEILIIDEVLAVGDAQFQKKCLGKMREVSRDSGRTVIFVSHNLGSVANLCTRGVMLQGGMVTFEGAAKDTIEAYLLTGSDSSGEKTWDLSAEPPSSSGVRIRAVRVLSDGEPKATVSIDRAIELSVEFETLVPDLELSTSFHVVHPWAGEILSTANFPSASLGKDEWFGKKYPIGLFRATCTIHSNFFNEGIYSVNVVIMRSVGQVEVIAREVLQFSVQDTGGMREEYTGVWIGVVRPRFHWRTELISKNI